jgi:distribution and morphology protein 34
LSSEKLAFGSQMGNLGAPFSPPSESSASNSSGGILEQAWLNKIAKDIARKVEEERRRQNPEPEKGGARREQMMEELPPPAYAV